ncbi:unnamed protein product [Eruca vesicaria subsp. sativa]|uniref:BCAS3 domain-containing protein n=1 Tax=Eruca vesicaria subsp. sativa TaxID=29727 RepID=A0ABC8ISA5_ERUVS|nr:unnamed protein product [Eruca vesicaria subsp. sativa]
MKSVGFHFSIDLSWIPLLLTTMMMCPGAELQPIRVVVVVPSPLPASVISFSSSNGRTAKEWKKLLPYLRSRLGEDCNIRESLTSGPSHAIDITREAIRNGPISVLCFDPSGMLLVTISTQGHNIMPLQLLEWLDFESGSEIEPIKRWSMIQNQSRREMQDQHSDYMEVEHFLILKNAEESWKVTKKGKACVVDKHQMYMSEA